jgi:hypothetical protein
MASEAKQAIENMAGASIGVRVTNVVETKNDFLTRVISWAGVSGPTIKRVIRI